MPSTSADKLSTSRLAKRAAIDSRQLFERLLARKWLTRTTGPDGKNQYQLTAKGEFEGGEYRESDKFGRYIVWPESLLQHQLLQGLSETMLTATQLGKSASVPARLVNLLLADLGWIEPVASGWQLTAAGERLGAVQKETEQGATYVSWPITLQQLAEWQQSIAQLDPNHSHSVSLDGRQCRSSGERLLANWLYLHRISYACGRLLRLENDDDLSVTVDFYLPQSGLVIEYWGYPDGATGTDFLQQKLQHMELIKQSSYTLLEVREQDLSQLDQILAKALLKLGFKAY